MGATTTKHMDELSIRQRTCQSCGMLLDDAGEFHPAVFCTLKKAGHNPWDELAWVCERLGFSLPSKPPLVRNLPLDFLGRRETKR